MNGKLMEKTEKIFYWDEDKAEREIEKRKTETEGDLIDYKLSKKETKSSTYFILTLKTRFLSLNEAKGD